MFHYYTLFPFERGHDPSIEQFLNSGFLKMLFAKFFLCSSSVSIEKDYIFEVY